MNIDVITKGQLNVLVSRWLMPLRQIQAGCMYALNVLIYNDLFLHIYRRFALQILDS